MSCGGEHQPQGKWTNQLLLGAESRPPGDLQQDLLSSRLNQQEVRGGTSDSTSSIRLYSNTKQRISHQSRTTSRVSEHLRSQSRVGHAPWWPDGAAGRRPVSEGVPLALDAGTGRVEGLPDADRVQSRLVGQFGQQL